MKEFRGDFRLKVFFFGQVCQFLKATRRNAAVDESGNNPDHALKSCTQRVALLKEQRHRAIGDVAAPQQKQRISIDFSLVPFVRFGQENGCSCIMYYEENELAKQQRTAIITIDPDSVITSFEEKPKEPKSNLAVPPFYYYLARDVKRIPEALEAGCGYDAPGSFAAWLSSQTAVRAYRMPGSRYDIGNLESYERIKASYKGVLK